MQAMWFLFLAALFSGAQANKILHTDGFELCQQASDIEVRTVDITYDATTKKVNFNLAGSSSRSMKVNATLDVLAYGKSVYSRTFSPCDSNTFVQQLCPVPQGDFSASGTQDIPDSYASMIPAIAFSVPDIAARATLKLTDADGQSDVACIQSSVTNGKTIEVPAVSWVAASLAGVALIVTGASAALGAGAGAGAGAGHASPGFAETLIWFQGIAMNGMLSVDYPPVYRSFTKNFAFSTGLVPWTAMQTAIDNFRGATGGNTTNNNVKFLLQSAQNSSTATIVRRGMATLVTRDAGQSDLEKKFSGIKEFSEQIMIPASNTFMTVLLIAAIVIASIAVGILAFKVILEAWALFASFPKSLVGFRKHYWATMARTIVQLILVLYGVWVLYCIFQFTQGDSWAAQTLAGITLALFTGVLGFFTFKIWQTAARLKKSEGDADGLYNDKATWMKYSIFYDVYKRQYWWLFVPVILYMFAKGVILSAGEGHGLGQTIAQLIVEFLMLVLLIWKRPFERKSGNVINIFIQVVRALSVICIIVFVQELGFEETSQTIVGLVLIVVQSVLTGLLGILILVNAIILMVKENPHRRRRKELEKANRDTFTPLGPLEDGMLSDPSKLNATSSYTLADDDDFYHNNDKKMLPIAAAFTEKPLTATSSTSSGMRPLQLVRSLESEGSRDEAARLWETSMAASGPTHHRSTRSQDSSERLLAEYNHSPERWSPFDRGATSTTTAAAAASKAGGAYRGVAF